MKLSFCTVTKFVLLLEVVTCILFSDLLFNSIDSTGSVVQEARMGSLIEHRVVNRFLSRSTEFDVTRTVDR